MLLLEDSEGTVIVISFRAYSLSHSTGGMVGAIQRKDCDIVGIARPLAVEPQFVSGILTTATLTCKM